MKKLYRSKRDRKIAGICGGIGEYFEIDPTIIRLVAIFIFIFTGLIPMTLAYLIMWAVVPQNPD